MSGTARRMRLRERLRLYFGDRCWWCGGMMEFPVRGKPITSLPEMATIEHFRQKQVGSSSVIHLRLSHKRCNQ